MYDQILIVDEQVVVELMVDGEGSLRGWGIMIVIGRVGAPKNDNHSRRQ
jgi:hypothetical protein